MQKDKNNYNKSDKGYIKFRQDLSQVVLDVFHDMIIQARQLPEHVMVNNLQMGIHSGTIVNGPALTLKETLMMYSVYF